MRKKSLLGCALATLVTVLLPLVTTATTDRSSGTWRMNTAKSKYNPGPAPQSLTIVIESDENNYKLDATGTDGNGKPLHVQYSAKFDGKDYPATGIEGGGADIVSIRRIDANTIETMQKKDGRVVMLILSKVSKDGKTWTSPWSGKNAEGKDVHNVVVFDKQRTRHCDSPPCEWGSVQSPRLPAQEFSSRWLGD
jgi:hypothetical protein